MNLLNDGVAQLRRFADYRGRSTRTDLVAFWLVTTAAGVALLAAASILELAASPASSLATIASQAYGMLLLVPAAALGARRLHDRGQSAWWLALGIPALVQSAAKAYYQLTGDYDAMFAQTSSAPHLAGAFLGLALIIFLFLPGEEGDNRYGPNPRYADAGEPA